MRETSMHYAQMGCVCDWHLCRCLMHTQATHTCAPSKGGLHANAEASDDEDSAPFSSDAFSLISCMRERRERMKEGKKVRRKIFADGTYAYIDKNYLGSEALMYNSIGRATPVLWLIPETILATDWEEV